MMRRFGLFLLMLGALVAALSPAFSPPAVGKPPARIPKGAVVLDPLPVDAYKELASRKQWLNVARPLTKKDLAGRIILLDFWTYCCVNCLQAIPDLKYLEQKFGDSLTIIGVHSAKFANEKDTENIRQAILRYGITHPVINDADFGLWKAFHVGIWPTFVLIDPTGGVVNNYLGEGHRAELEQAINILHMQYVKKMVSSPLPLAPEKDKVPASVLSFPAKLDTIPDYEGPDNKTTPALALSDSGNNRILIVDESGAILKSFGSGEAGLKDGTAEEAQFNHPQGVLYGDGFLYVADTENHALRRIMLATGAVDTLAGTGHKDRMGVTTETAGKNFSLASPWDLAFFPDHEHITIAMAGSHQLWEYGLKDGVIRAVAGNGFESLTDGIFPKNMLAQPSGLSAFGGALWFVDAESSSLRTMAKEGDRITTRVGKGLFDFGYLEGAKDKARMQHPLGVYAEDSGIYIADTYNHAIRRYDAKNAVLENFAGTGKRGFRDGAKDMAEFNEPGDIARIGDMLYITDTNNHRIRTLELASGKVGELAVMPQETEAPPTLSDFLPNMTALPEIAAAPGKKFMITFDLAPGWHINKEAPSYLALFDEKGMAVQSFRWEALSKGNVAFEVPAGKTRLQGTFYYCADKAGSLCLIKSFDAALTAAAGGKGSLSLPLR